MKKTHGIAFASLATLMATAAIPAMAQSSVQLYGRVNTTLERQTIGNESVVGLFNNSSRIGFRGTEDLGGGLKAGFVLESGFNSDTGTASNGALGMSFQRQSELNLSGSFGVLRLGNFAPESYFASADYVSMHNHDTGSSSDALYVDPNWMGAGAATQGGPGGTGSGNKMAYRTPSLGGFTVEGAISLHEKAAGTNSKNGYDLAANYNTGPVHLGAGYSKWDENWQASLRALHVVGPFVLGGYYQRNDDNLLGSRNSLRVSGMYAMGASEFHINIGRAGTWSELDNSAAMQWTLGYNYNLSKRTKVYSYYTRVNNKDNAAYSTGRAGVDFSSFAVGVRHNF